jgi:antitoxin VapB
MESAIAKLFSNGRSQAVRLPKEFRFAGDRVRVTRQGAGVLLEPVISDPGQWFAAIDAAGDGTEFMPEGRSQPPAPRRDVFP